MTLLRLIVVIAVLLPIASPVARAVQPDEILSNPALETRARALSKQLRCMVCQNQSIDDSDAPLARDLRVLVRERLTAGDSDRQVIDFLVTRYGEFVLLNPRFSWNTALLWLGPPAVLIVGAIALVVLMRRKRQRTDVVSNAIDEPELSSAEEARLAQILKRGEG